MLNIKENFMKIKKEYEGNNYTFKKNSIKKILKKYNQTYQYVLVKILKYKKYLKKFQNNTSLDNNYYLLNIVESTASDFEIDNSKVYNNSNINKRLIKSLKKELKYEKKTKETNNLNVIKLYKMIVSEDYKNLRTIAIDEPEEFLKALYLYTIVED